MPEETPDKRKQREKEEIERKRREQESLEFQQRFDLSPTEPLIEDYSCAHTTTGAIYQGRLYLSKSYMCFYSPLFSKLLRVNLRKLVEIEKRSTLGVFPNGIEVTTENGKKISFISFIYRDQAYNTLARLVRELVCILQKKKNCVWCVPPHVFPTERARYCATTDAAWRRAAEHSRKPRGGQG